MKLMKSLTLNAVVLYILLKSPVSDLIFAKLPNFLKNLKTVQQMREELTALIYKSSKLSIRITAIVALVLAIWLVKKIWDRVQGRDMMSRFVEKYLCDGNVMGTCKGAAYMPEVDRKRFFLFQSLQKRGKVSNRLDQQRYLKSRSLSLPLNKCGELDSCATQSLPLFSKGLVSNRVL